jgi:uncharacterized protein DUF1206
MGTPSLATVAGRSRRTARKASHMARAISESKPVQFLARFGYVVRGVLYLVPGLLALELAVRHGGAAMAPAGTIVVIGRQPFGRVLLLVVLVGLVGYAVWGLTRAFLDPWGRGTSPRGLGRRIGYASSALAYMSFVLVTFHLLMGSASDADHTRAWATRLLTRPMGAWILGTIGLCWIVFAGLFEMVMGWTGGFERDLRWERMRPSEHWWARRIGRIGIVARGAIFTVIGVLLLLAAFHGNPRQAGGMGEALEAIARQPFGRSLLAVSAAGLIVFGAFSILCARWMRTRSGAYSGRSRPPVQPREVRHGLV